MASNDPYSTSYGSMSQKMQGSSSFFKRSMLTSTTSTTITGKSSNPKRNVGIKVKLHHLHDLFNSPIKLFFLIH